MPPTVSQYARDLKHPNWQRKRLEILSRDEFTCANCATGSETLHVHHSYYEKGLKPWDYPAESLHVLCETCHKHAQDDLTHLHRQIGRLALPEQSQLLGMALGLEMQREPDLRVSVQSYEVADGIARLLGVRVSVVIGAIAPDWTVCAHDVSTQLVRG